MLTGITLENFKAFKDPQFIRIKPITLVFGQNNAGKSSIIHALAFLRHVHDTNGDCNPGRMTYGWSNLDLGSWKNLVFGENESASMMIRLETKTTAIQWRFEKARVASFKIEEKFGEDWIPTAEGKNVGTKVIIWRFKLHSSHSLWEQYKEAMWDRLTGRVSFRNLEPDQYGITGVKTVIDETAIQKCPPQLREKFEKHFDLWLGDTWRTPPLGCDPDWIDQADIPFEGLFPRQSLPNSYLTQKTRSKKTEITTPVFSDSPYIHPESPNSEKTLTDNAFVKLLESLHRETLTPEESEHLFNDLYAGGEIGFVDALHVEELLSSFVSHLHLDAQRFPPNGTLSKNRLSSSKPEDQPWIRLLDDDYKHHFYSHFSGDVDHFKSIFKFPEEIFREIKRSLENHDLSANWRGILQRLVDAGADKRGIQELHDSYKDLLAKAKLGDLPPILAVNTGLRQLGIQYSLEMRKRVEKIYPPNIDPRRGEEVSAHEVSENWDTELVFKGKSGVHTLHNLGSGVRVIVPVIVALSSAEVALLSVEEPECHVHPKLQTELGDLLIQRLGWTYYVEPVFDPENPFCSTKFSRSHKENRRSSYTFVETHSEHLILRILRRIRETTEKDFDDWPDIMKEACPDGIQPEDVSVLYVEPGDHGAKVIELPVTPQGGFSRPWPGGFFEEQLKELG